MTHAVARSAGRRVGFRYDLRAEVLPGDATYLLSESGITALQGRSIAAIAPLLDGQRDLDQIARDLADDVSPAVVGQLVGALMQAGLVRYRHPQPGSPNRTERAYWDHAGLDGDSGYSAVRAAALQVVCVGDIDPDSVRSIAHTCGIRVRTAHATAASRDPVPGDHKLQVVLTDDYLRPELQALDAAAAQSSRPWLLAKPLDTTVWLGPVFGAPDGACWSCLAHRLRANRSLEQPLSRALGLGGPLSRPRPHTMASSTVGISMALLEATKWIAGQRHLAQQAITCWNSASLESHRHPVERRPQCPVCGEPALVQQLVDRPVRIAPNPILYRTGNGDRTEAPESVLRRYGHLVDPITGVIRAVTAHPKAPPGSHAYVSCPNPAAAAVGADELRAGLRQVCGGKGRTALDARVSAVCEALERYSGQLHGDELRVRGSLAELVPDALDPNAVTNYDPRQFADRESWNASRSMFQYVPEPLDPYAVIDWTPVWSLSDHRQRLLPTGSLYFDCSANPDVPPVAGSRYTVADSNGNAAGTCLEDAIVQGFLELVERDATAIWWYNRLPMPPVELTALGDPWLGEQIELHRRVDRELWTLDLTGDLGIPVVAALSRRTDKATEDILLGFGAHFDPAIAAARAVAEVAQLLPAAVDVQADGTGYGSVDADVLHWWRSCTVANQRYLAPDRSVTPATRVAFPPRTDLRADVERIVELLRARGMELLVLDQTRPDIGLPVVKTIVPGLRQFWARLGPGRLFDVPVAMGRRGAPMPYADLNPIPLFL